MFSIANNPVASEVAVITSLDGTSFTMSRASTVLTGAGSPPDVNPLIEAGLPTIAMSCSRTIGSSLGTTRTVCETV